MKLDLSRLKTLETFAGYTNIQGYHTQTADTLAIVKVKFLLEIPLIYWLLDAGIVHASPLGVMVLPDHLYLEHISQQGILPKTKQRCLCLRQICINLLKKQNKYGKQKRNIYIKKKRAEKTFSRDRTLRAMDFCY